MSPFSLKKISSFPIFFLVINSLILFHIFLEFLSYRWNLYRSNQNRSCFLMQLLQYLFFLLIQRRMLLVTHDFSFNFFSNFESLFFNAFLSAISTNLFSNSLNISSTLLRLSKWRLFLSSRSFENVSLKKFFIPLILTLLILFFLKISLTMTKLGIWTLNLCTKLPLLTFLPKLLIEMLSARLGLSFATIVVGSKLSGCKKLVYKTLKNFVNRKLC